jgi:hypothetical protein
MPGWDENGLTNVCFTQADSFYDRSSFNESTLIITQNDEIQGV